MSKNIIFIISGVFLGFMVFFYIKLQQEKPELESKRQLIEQYQEETNNLISLLDSGLKKINSLHPDSAAHLIQIDSIQQAILNFKPMLKSEVDSIRKALQGALSDINLNDSSEADVNLVKYKIKALRDDYVNELNEVQHEKRTLGSNQNKYRKRIMVFLALTVLSLLIGLRINLNVKSAKK